MPNWCTNRLEVSGDPETLRRFVAEQRPDGADSGLSLAKAVPLPETFLERRGLTDPIERSRLAERVDDYRWRLQYWGTKWDIADVNIQIVGNARDSETAFYHFDSAWSPPEHWFRMIADRYSTLDFALTYAEPGCDFQGQLKARGGRVTEAAADFNRTSTIAELLGLDTLYDEDEDQPPPPTDTNGDGEVDFPIPPTMAEPDELDDNWWDITSWDARQAVLDAPNVTSDTIATLCNQNLEAVEWWRLVQLLDHPKTERDALIKVARQAAKLELRSIFGEAGTCSYQQLACMTHPKADRSVWEILANTGIPSLCKAISAYERVDGPMRVAAALQAA